MRFICFSKISLVDKKCGTAGHWGQDGMKPIFVVFATLELGAFPLVCKDVQDDGNYQELL